MSPSSQLGAFATDAGLSVERDPHQLTVVKAWQNLDELLARSDAASTPWVMLEQAEDGAVALGPRFSTSEGPCFRCYVLRRMSHGARSLEPPRMLGHETRRALSTCLQQLARRTPGERALQYVVEPSGRTTAHVVLAVPGCRRCYATGPEVRSLGVDDLVSSRVGLIHSLPAFGQHEALLPTVRAIGARTDAFNTVRAFNAGCASDLTYAGARLRALGESLERYCAAFVSESSCLATRAELEGDVALSACSLHAHGSGAESAVTWVRGVRLESGAPVWLPGAAVHIPYCFAPGESAAETLSSNGLATGTSFDDAVERALLELHERDAFMRAWRGALTPYALDDAELIAPGLQVVRVPSSSGPPVVAAFLEQVAPPYSVWGVACRRSVREASRAAQLEAVSAHAVYTQVVQTAYELPDGPPRTLAHHALAHAVRPELRRARARWLAPVREPTEQRARARWQWPLQHAVAVDLTTDDVRAAGLSVVRVLVPGSLPLDTDALRPSLPGDPAPHPLG